MSAQSSTRLYNWLKGILSACPKCASISIISPGKCSFAAVSGANWSRAYRASNCSRKDSCKSFLCSSPAHWEAISSLWSSSTNFFASCASGKNLFGCITYRLSSIFNGVSVYSLQGSISSSCETVKVGLLFTQWTLAGVKPSVGCTDWVCDDELFSFEMCSFEMHVGRLMCASSFRDVVVWETFLKVDGMCKSCRNVGSWLINFRHLSSPWMNSLSAWSLCTTSGVFLLSCVTLGKCRLKESSTVFTWGSCDRCWETVMWSSKGVDIHFCQISVIHLSCGGNIWGNQWLVSKCVCHCPVHWSCLNSCHKVYHWCRIPKICAVDKYVHFIVSAVFLKICWMWVLKCKKNGVTQSKIKPDVMWYVMHQSVFARPLKESSVDIVTKVKWEECVGTHPVLWG